MAGAGVPVDVLSDEEEGRLSFIGATKTLGHPVEGLVGGPDPFASVQAAVQDGAFDEIIVSTLPRATSKWLRRGLVQRIEKLGLPVTAIVPAKGRLSREEELLLGGAAGTGGGG